ncbi:MAG: hypothetical protein VX733_06595 [Candidatus Latescibacterota bacterium]|nr:hypothetical protein [Candidatus Latescibacterota bacterium]
MAEIKSPPASAESKAAGHEISDVDAGPLAKVGIAMALVVLVAFVGMVVMFKVMAYYQPLFDDTPHALSTTRQLPAEPRLQVDPPVQKGDLKAHEDHLLSTYDWVDPNAKIARIPIDRAIAIIAAKGSPDGAE